ncbi:MAG: hypothetical protein ACRDNS_13710 [Trebonia sp.]
MTTSRRPDGRVICKDPGTRGSFPQHPATTGGITRSIDAALIVDNLRLIEGYDNEGVAQQMSVYQEAISDVPQRA